ncbi:MAG: hypothetical protein HZA16_11670 [Nitrospirae bacterium]|nr:hypothetical protein [Nitrospirota bacterium]
MSFPGSKDRYHWTIFVLLAAALGTALFIRTASFRNFVNPEGGFFFYSIDAYDHLRRVTLGVHSFPSIPAFDYYVGYPEGTGQIWSPLFDYVLSAAALIAGGGRVATETVCFFSNPFFAGLTVLLIFIAAAKLFSSPVAGIAAAFLLALSPGHISYSIPMNFDHHVLESIAVLFLLCLPFLERDDRLSLKGKLAAAFLIVLALFMWRGSTVYWGAAFLAVFIRSFISDRKGLSLDYAVSFLLASVVVAIVCVINPWGSASSVSFGIISWFHVIMLASLAAVLMLFSVCRTKKAFFYSLAGVTAAGTMSLALPQLRDFLSGILSGISFLRGGGDPWLESNSELHGVFSGYNFLYSASYLTAAWFAAPFGAALALIKWKKDGMNNKYLITFVAWSPLLLLGLIRRYTPIAGVMSSLAGAYLIAGAWQYMRSPWKRAVIAVGAALLLLPSFQHYKVTVNGHLPAYLKEGLYGRDGALEWIKNNTPKTSYHLEPTEQPEYGIMADWDLGAKLYHLAERPAVATAFGWETHGFYELAGFMATTRPETAFTIVRDNRVRYVLLSAFRSLETDHAIARDGEAKGKLPLGTVGKFNQGLSIYNRLLYNDGSGRNTADSFIPALGNYRLLFESAFLAGMRESGAPVSYFKVFEAVPGARIRGKGKPGVNVSIIIRLLSSQKRLLSYRDVVATDEHGNFSFTVPYSTEGKQGDTQPMDAYLLTGAGMEETKVAVSENDIITGGTVSVRPVLYSGTGSGIFR